MNDDEKYEEFDDLRMKYFKTKDERLVPRIEKLHGELVECGYMTNNCVITKSRRKITESEA